MVPPAGSRSIAIGCLLLVLTIFISGCTETPQSFPDTMVPTTHKTPVPTATPEKEIVYIYVTVTVTPTTPTPVPTPTKDKKVVSDLIPYNAWRYQSVSKDDGAFRYGAVTALLNHLDKAPDAKSYELYYQGGRRWKEDLVRLIDNVIDESPGVQSEGMRSAVSNYTVNLTIQNGTINTLDRVMTNWEFDDAGQITNGIVVNITNATTSMDREVSLIT